MSARNHRSTGGEEHETPVAAETSSYIFDECRGYLGLLSVESNPNSGHRQRHSKRSNLTQQIELKMNYIIERF